jgi:hypothetical protein
VFIELNALGYCVFIYLFIYFLTQSMYLKSIGNQSDSYH